MGRARPAARSMVSPGERVERVVARMAQLTPRFRYPGWRCARSSSRGPGPGGRRGGRRGPCRPAGRRGSRGSCRRPGRGAPRPGGGTGSWRGRSRPRRPPRARSRAGRGRRAPRCPRSERSGRRRPRRGPRRRACGRRPGLRRGAAFLDGRARAGRLDDGGGQQRAGEVRKAGRGRRRPPVTGGGRYSLDGRPAPGPWRPVVRANVTSTTPASASLSRWNAATERHAERLRRLVRDSQLSVSPSSR